MLSGITKDKAKYTAILQQLLTQGETHTQTVTDNTHRQTQTHQIKPAKLMNKYKQESTDCLPPRHVPDAGARPAGSVQTVRPGSGGAGVLSISQIKNNKIPPKNKLLKQYENIM